MSYHPLARDHTGQQGPTQGPTGPVIGVYGRVAARPSAVGRAYKGRAEGNGQLVTQSGLEDRDGDSSEEHLRVQCQRGYPKVSALPE